MLRVPRLFSFCTALSLQALGSCTEPTEPFRFPPTAVRFEPPSVFAEWWRLAEACTGRTGALSAITWYHSASAGELVHDGLQLGGVWFPDGRRILLDRAEMVRGATVRHEMIHALLPQGGHPRAVFDESCAHLQRCIGCGYRESQRGVPAAAAETSAVVLHVTIEAEPSPISAGVHEGRYRLVVSAHNPLDEDVWVRVPAGAAFLFMEAGRTGSYVPTDESRWAFRAHEVRRYAFDVRDTAGTYRFFGGFAGKSSDTITVQVLP